MGEYYLTTVSGPSGSYDYFLRVTGEFVPPDPRHVQRIRDLALQLIHSQPNSSIYTITDEGFTTFSGEKSPFGQWTPPTPLSPSDSETINEILGRTPGLAPNAITQQHLWHHLFTPLISAQTRPSFNGSSHSTSSAASGTPPPQSAITRVTSPSSWLNGLPTTTPYAEMPPDIQRTVMRHLFYLPHLTGQLEERIKKHFEEMAKQEKTSTGALYCRELSRLKKQPATPLEQILDSYYQGRSITEALQTLNLEEEWYADFRALAINSRILIDDTDREWARHNYLRIEYNGIAIQALEKHLYQHLMGIVA